MDLLFWSPWTIQDKQTLEREDQILFLGLANKDISRKTYLNWTIYINGTDGRSGLDMKCGVVFLYLDIWI